MCIHMYKDPFNTHLNDAAKSIRSMSYTERRAVR